MKWRMSKTERLNTTGTISKNQNLVVTKKELEESHGLQGAVLCPLAEVNGYLIRPGFYRMKGAFETKNGVSFTISSHGATGAELLLYEPRGREPKAIIPIPEEYRIGDTYSILVFGIRIQDFEYAYRFDGPYEPESGITFNKESIILDPYARAVSGQRHWGERPEGGKDFEYRARVVKSEFDWGEVGQLNTPIEDLVIYETHVRGFTKDHSSKVDAKGTFQ